MRKCGQFFLKHGLGISGRAAAGGQIRCDSHARRIELPRRCTNDEGDAAGAQRDIGKSSAPSSAIGLELRGRLPLPGLVGNQVNVAAHRMRSRLHRSIQLIRIEFTGAGQGEKLSERLNLQSESLAPTAHSRIFQLASQEEPGQGRFQSLLKPLQEAAEAHDEAKVLRLLLEAVPEFVPAPELLKKWELSVN